jgi:hypothetical protein
VDFRGQLPGTDNTVDGPHYASRKVEDIRFLVVHHSGVDADSSAETIAVYHTQPHGPNLEVWPGCAYAFVCRWDGSIEYATDILRCGYGVARRNTECLSICLPGNWQARAPGTRQLAGAADVIEWLLDLMPWCEVVGHRDVALPAWPTNCPGNSWPTWRASLS